MPKKSMKGGKGKMHDNCCKNCCMCCDCGCEMGRRTKCGCDCC